MEQAMLGLSNPSLSVIFKSYWLFSIDKIDISWQCSRSYSLYTSPRFAIVITITQHVSKQALEEGYDCTEDELYLISFYLSISNTMPLSHQQESIPYLS